MVDLVNLIMWKLAAQIMNSNLAEEPTVVSRQGDLNITANHFA